MPGLKLVVITGLSGAGKSHALKCFEDAGYFCVDNLPTQLIPTFAELRRWQLTFWPLLRPHQVSLLDEFVIQHNLMRHARAVVRVRCRVFCRPRVAHSFTTRIKFQPGRVSLIASGTTTHSHP